MKRLYIAYGSNLNVRQMETRCPNAKILGTAKLKGWELLFKGSKSGSYLTIEKKENVIVPVVIWKVDKTDEKHLTATRVILRFTTRKISNFSTREYVQANEEQ